VRQHPAAEAVFLFDMREQRRRRRGLAMLAGDAAGPVVARYMAFLSDIDMQDEFRYH